jgi:hypothetical protein
VRWVTSSIPVAIVNYWNTTLMPTAFRWTIAAIMAGNLAAICFWYVFWLAGIVACFSPEGLLHKNVFNLPLSFMLIGNTSS